MKIERKLQKRAAGMLCTAVLCLGLSSCVSPDLEPPGSLGSRPQTPNAAGHGAKDDSKAADAAVAAPTEKPMGSLSGAGGSSSMESEPGSEPREGTSGDNAEDADAGVGMP